MHNILYYQNKDKFIKKCNFIFGVKLKFFCIQKVFHIVWEFFLWGFHMEYLVKKNYICFFKKNI